MYMCQWELIGSHGRITNALIPGLHVPQTNDSQIGGHRLSTSWRVVEHPDHHCGDDLVVRAVRRRLLGNFGLNIMKFNSGMTHQLHVNFLQKVRIAS